ncbi:hypothetical protein ON010_g11651 [Phytophthora cinnamomi]|nr:hypothetical protein ON010_g11651 [Phytophthora cinnamomi]
MAPLRRPESTRNSPVKTASPVKSVDLAAYYAFSRRNSKVVHDDTQGLSGFLEYRKLNGTWRPFLFQTMGHQLVLYRVHVGVIVFASFQSTHQVLVMSTDIRSASEIALDYEGAKGINGTTITLRAVTHRAAMYWVDGLQRLKDGKPLQIISDPPCAESEEDIFDEIDKLLSLREWAPPPPTTPLCGLCISVRKPEPPTTGMLLSTKTALARQRSADSSAAFKMLADETDNTRNNKKEMMQWSHPVEALDPNFAKAAQHLG